LAPGGTNQSSDDVGIVHTRLLRAGAISGSGAQTLRVAVDVVPEDEEA
jgi:hypothetical protein